MFLYIVEIKAKNSRLTAYGGKRQRLVSWAIFFFILVIAQYKPTDATTNPSLLYAAAQLPQYEKLTAEAISFAKGASRYITCIRLII